MKDNPKKIITPTGYWVCDDPSQYKFDPQLAAELVAFFHHRQAKVLDLGCGNGGYVNHLRSFGVQALGCDGNPHTPQIAGPYTGVCDLTTPQIMNRADWVMCLEVAEHIPRDLEAGLIFNLHNNNREGMVLSWAIPGQPGHGHVNCRSNDEVIAMFSEEYEYDQLASQLLRDAATLPWFKNTIMVFKRLQPVVDVTPAMSMDIQLNAPTLAHAH